MDVGKVSRSGTIGQLSNDTKSVAPVEYLVVISGERRSVAFLRDQDGDILHLVK